MTAETAALLKAFASLPAHFHQDCGDHQSTLAEWFQSLELSQQKAVREMKTDFGTESLSARWRRADTGWRFSEKKLKLMFRTLLETKD